MRDHGGVTDELQVVVAGFDGRWQDDDFLRHAAREAASRHWPLTIVTVLRYDGALDRRPRAGIDSPASAAAARDRLAQAAARMRQEFPTLSVRAFTTDEYRIDARRHPMNRAGLLVIGGTGASGKASGGPGTISHRLIAAARCPILIVPDAPAPDDDIDVRETTVTVTETVTETTTVIDVTVEPVVDQAG